MGSESPEPRQYEVVRGRQNVNPATGLMSPPPSDLSETSFGEEGFPGLNTLPMPRFNDGGEDSDEDSDEDREDTALGLVHERTITASSISLDLQERLDAQHKVNNDLRKKLTEAELNAPRQLRVKGKMNGRYTVDGDDDEYFENLENGMLDGRGLKKIEPKEKTAAELGEEFQKQALGEFYRCC